MAGEFTFNETVKQTSHVEKDGTLVVTGIYTPPEYSEPPSNLIPNPLLSYPSYTYNVSLHLLTVDDYNKIVKEQTYTPQNVLIASAGRRESKDDPNFKRQANFHEDFYFENLELETIIGLNETSRATNAVSINFRIVEPYGLSLFDRLIDANVALGNENYLASPYLLQIDFFGIDSKGNITSAVANLQKRIPIRIIKLDIKANAQGSEYDLEAVPYNHSAYDLTTASTPANFEVTAGTVQGFFGKPSQGSSTDTTIYREQDTPGQEITGGAATYVSESYSAAINIWNEELKRNNKIKTADRYEFKFYDGIGESKFGEIASRSNINATKENTGNTKNDIAIEMRSAVSPKSTAVDITKRVFTINTGTSIDSIINYVVRNSVYIQDQLEKYTDKGSNPEDWLEGRKSLKWFKIVPTIELKEYDEIRKDYGRVITYHVFPYTVYNAKASAAPKAKVPNDKILKEYNYLYTGKNTDVLDLNIEFNALYYTAVTAYKQRPNVTKRDLTDREILENPTAYTSYQVKTARANAVYQAGEKPISRNNSTGMGYEMDAAGLGATDVQESLYTNSGADMINLSLKIFGDPSFIKQDDIFYSPEATRTTESPDEINVDSRLTANGSIKTDYGEVYVTVNIETKTDIDEKTGLMTSYLDIPGTSVFSGIYRVLTVKSEFSGGQFVQHLNLIRLPRQIPPANEPAKNSERANTENNKALQNNDVGITYNEQADISTTETTNHVEEISNTRSAPPIPVAETPVNKKLSELRKVVKNAETKVIRPDTLQPVAPKDIRNGE